MKNLTYKEFIAEFYPFMEYVHIATRQIELEEDEYFALLVIDSNYPVNNSPHVKALSFPDYKGIVGIEKSSGENNYYISKSHYNRKASYRGDTIIVKILDISKCRKLQ